MPAEAADSAGRVWVAGIPARLLAAPCEIALPHGRPAADSARSEVPAARNRVEPEPVHALAGAFDRAESGGASYGQEPDPVVWVPAPAGQGLDIPHPAHDEAAHSGVATLRLRGFDSGGEPPPPHGQVWPPAGPQAEAEPVTDRPEHRPGEAWPPAGPQAAPEPAHPRPHGESGPGSPHVPQPHIGADAEPVRADLPPRPTAVPGPAAADIVAQAVARGMACGTEKGAEREEGDTQGLSRVAPVRGAAVTEVPVHLPFLGESRRTQAQARAEAQAQARARAEAQAQARAEAQAQAQARAEVHAHTPVAAPRPRAPRPAPGRRVPRGDDRLREHRGPVLPGWVGVGVGGLALAGCLAVLWRAGAVPATLVAAFGATPRAYQGLRATHWPPLAFLGIVALLALGGLGRAKAGHAWVLTLFGRYRGTVRRTGLTWVSPLLLRRRIDVRLRHWRSEPMPAVDSGGLALRVVVQVVWQVKDTARAMLAVEDHTDYLAEQVESAMARVLSQLPADAFHEDAPTLRDAEAVGDALTRMLATETEAVGIEVYSAQPTRIEYAPEVAEAMRRRRVAAIDAKHRDTVLTSIVDAVDDTVHRLTSRGLVELDDYERKALVKDLTVAFYTGRSE
ncbi:SPFH domain-containing protein [Streptomyces sp. NPDC050448]|uniref:SPFH domain-containing protein n=1 Tax=Streptomyces sp. NPDC050448 TaxID=3155404 RepID=UPI00343D3558